MAQAPPNGKPGSVSVYVRPYDGAAISADTTKITDKKFPKVEVPSANLVSSFDRILQQCFHGTILYIVTV